MLVKISVVGQEVHFGAALLGLADDLHRAGLEAVAHCSISRSCGMPLA
jgi:hypothetical protein